MKYLQSYYTDIGVKRKSNQDSLALLKADTDFGEVLLLLVCDGMGGHQFGELASKIIVKAFEKWFKQKLPYILYKEFKYQALKSSWTALIEECNAELVAYGEKNRAEIGSTLTCMLFAGSNYYIAHVGDSRAYAIGEIQALQLTHDHSLIAEELRKGMISEEDAANDKRKNILTECVGITKDVKIEFTAGTIQENVCYMLCTDGFWHFLTEEDLTHYLSGSRFTDNKMIRMHLNYLVEQVKERGEKDNISVVSAVPKETQEDGQQI